MELKRKVIRGFGIVFGASFFSRALQFLGKIILAWFLLPKDFGLFAASFLVVSVLEVFRSSGLEQSLIYTKKDIAKATSTIFLMQLAISVALFAAVFFSAGFAGQFFGKSPAEALEIEKIIRALSVILVVNSVGAVHSALLEKKMEFRKRVAPDVASSLAYFATAVALAAQGFGVWSLVIATIISSTIYNAMMLLLSPVKISLNADLALAKELFGYGKFVIAASILGFAIMNLDIAVIGRMLSAESLGIYAMAMTVSMLVPAQLSFVIGKVTFPAYSLIMDEKEKVRDAFAKSIRYVAVLFLPIAVGIIILAPFFVSVVLGKNWEKPGIVEVMQVLAINGFVRVIGSVSSPIFFSEGKPRIPAFGAFAQLVALAIIIVPATSAFGIIGASIAVTATTIVVMAYYILAVSKKIGFRIRLVFPQMARIFASGIIMAAATAMLSALFLPEKTLLNFAALCAASIISFAAAAFLLERKTLFEMLHEAFPATDK